jgi:hypothetical protein
MLKIKVTYGFQMPDIIRQTPGNSGIWGNCEFFINQDIEKCDFWIVYGRMLKIEKTICPEENVIFISGEPPTITDYEEKFLKQFNSVITCNKKLVHPNKIYTQLSLPWHIGYYINKFDYDELKGLELPRKTGLISAITSNKAVTEGHKKRIDFIFQLKEYFKDEMDIFGRGFNDIEDKSLAILGYKYHIVIENSSFRHYWTEKLSDAYLGFSYPIYYGCPNLNDFFPVDSFTIINIDNLDSSIKTIENIIQSNYFDRYANEILKSRNLILDNYNFFPRFHEFCNQYDVSLKKKEVVLKPEKKIFQRSFYYSIKNNKRYNFKMIFNIFNSRKKKFLGFSFIELIKICIKCLILWPNKGYVKDFKYYKTYLIKK